MKHLTFKATQVLTTNHYNMVRKFLQLLFMVMPVCLSCTQAANPPKISPSTQSKKDLGIIPDSVVKKIMGDSIANLIYSPKTVELLKLQPYEKPKDGDYTIGGVKVANNYGTINKKYVPIIQFLLCDSASFAGDKIVPASPFIPIMALNFKQKKDNVYLMFSFTSMEIAAVKNGKQIWNKHISNVRLFEKFFYTLTGDKDIEFYLKGEKL